MKTIIWIRKFFKSQKDKDLEKKMNSIKNIIDIHISDKISQTDSYMRGLANGMIMIDSILRDIQPVFIEELSNSSKTK